MINKTFRKFKYVQLCVLAVTIFLPLTLRAEDRSHDSLPPVVLAHVSVTLKEVGTGTYRKLGFSVYHASLWAPNGVWDAGKPYALKLQYTRSLSQETLADATIDNIRDEQVADEETMARWSAGIKKTMPAVEDGDVMIGVAVPGGESALFYNGKQIAKTQDQVLSKAFFDIWLGNGADEDLRTALLGRSE
jgi:Chalcone isomerase-like